MRWFIAAIRALLDSLKSHARPRRFGGYRLMFSIFLNLRESSEATVDGVLGDADPSIAFALALKGGPQDGALGFVTFRIPIFFTSRTNVTAYF